MIALNDDNKVKRERTYVYPHTLSILLILTALPILTGCQRPSSSSDDMMSAMGGEEMAGARSGATEGEIPPTCPFVEDGICDEPSQCSLGSDEEDCASACESPSLRLEAVCAYRTIPSPTPNVPLPRMNDLAQLGHFAGSLLIPSGERDGGQVARHYRGFLPQSAWSNATSPLLLMLPGHRVALDSLAHYTQLISTADVEGFIVVFVEQEMRSNDLRWAWWTDWNWTQPESAERNPDLILFEQLISELSSSLPIDLAQVYVSGHSRGGAMALIAAMERPDLFAGAISQSGFTEFGYQERLRLPEGEPPPALVFLHGVEDPDVCIDCAPNAQCAVTGRTCGRTYGSDGIVQALRDLGWPEERLIYYRLEGVAHRWQPQLNSVWWAWLSELTPQPDRPPISSRGWPTHAPNTVDPQAPEKRPNAPEVNLEKMAELSGGLFEMGRPYQPPQPYGDPWFIDQTPPQQVTVAPFHLDRHEVTTGEYALYLTHEGLSLGYHPNMPIDRSNDGYQPREGMAEVAMHHVSWSEAKNYCRWAGKRLPMEAEWEWVATGASDRAYPWAEEGGPTCTRAAVFKDGSFCEDEPTSVTARPAGATPEGIEGLIGNVSEWLEDAYQPYLDHHSGLELLLPETGLRVIRGGSLYHSGAWVNPKARWVAQERARGRSIGFRCAWDSSLTERDLPYLRGSLSPSTGALDSPFAPPPFSRPNALRLTADLITPQDLALWSQGWVIAEREAGRVSHFDGTTRSTLIDGLNEPIKVGVTGDLIWVGEASGEVIRWAGDDDMSRLQQGGGALDDLVADPRGVAWTRGGQLFWSATDQPTQMMESETTWDPPMILSLNEDELLMITLDEIWSIERATGAENMLFDASTLGGLMPSGITAEADSYYITVANTQWPYQGLLCELNILRDPELTCSNESPPRAESPVVISDKVYWETHRSIATRTRVNDQWIYELIGLWHRPEALQPDGAGGLIWLDPLEGTLWRGESL